MYWWVLRTHSGVTSNVQTYKLMSRRIKNKDVAEDWLEFCESQEKNKRHKFFLVQSDEFPFPD